MKPSQLPGVRDIKKDMFAMEKQMTDRSKS